MTNKQQETAPKRTHSEEARRRRSEAMKGNKRGLGHKHSEETLLKMSLAKLGRKLSQETKEKCRQARLGKKIPPEVVEKMRKAKLSKGQDSARAILFAFRGPDDKIYTGKNLMHFVRTHPHLFSKEDLVPFKPTKAFDCIATRRLYALKNGNRQVSWNGWKAIAVTSTEIGSKDVQE